jgi:CRP/FNR family cyclic AMP-dependent transcriptional regulator
MASTMLAKNKRDFNPKTFLATIGEGRKVVAFSKKQTIFAQGDPADAVFYIQEGKVRLTVVSKIGKEATLGILNEGQFFGEGSLAGQALRMGSATTMTECELLRIDKKAMMLALHREHKFSDLFVSYLLARNIRYEEDLVDQLFNSSEKRLARLLLLLAHFGKEGVPESVILTLLIAVTGLRIGEVLALKWEHVDWRKFRIRVVSNFVRGRFGEPKSAASKKPVVLHPLVMGLLKNWRETTTYAGDQNFIFASARLKGKGPRMPNMLVEDHLRPAAEKVIEIPQGHRFGFHNLRHALTSFLVEIGTDPKTIQDMLRWADPSILFKVYAHSRMDKRMEAQAKMIEATQNSKSYTRVRRFVAASQSIIPLITSAEVSLSP